MVVRPLHVICYRAPTACLPRENPDTGDRSCVVHRTPTDLTAASGTPVDPYDLGAGLPRDVA